MSVDFQREVTVDANGQARQAGASQAEGKFINDARTRAERSLYFFTKAILGRNYLNKQLHQDVANYLTRTPPWRKMLLLPREHCKTSIVSHAIPSHAIIQPKDHNIYIKGRAGVDSRILLAGETLDRAKKNLGTIEVGIFDNNKLFRALWPHAVWDTKPNRRWNENEMVVPRNVDYPDPTVQAAGVDAAIAGARFDIVIKDDLISLNAANSGAEMERAIRWHISSRALYESDMTLEYIIGTHWATYDLYTFIQQGGTIGADTFERDYTVQSMVRSIIENGEVIYPEKFSLLPREGKQDIEQLKRQFGLMFYLNYMNSAVNPELTDFAESNIRYFAIQGDSIVFESDDETFAKDVVGELAKSLPPLDDGIRGRRLNGDTFDLLKMRREHLSFKG